MRRLRPDSGARDETLRRLRRKSQSSRAADIKIIREITRDFFPFYGERKFEKKNKTKQKKRTKTARVRGGKKIPRRRGANRVTRGLLKIWSLAQVNTKYLITGGGG